MMAGRNILYLDLHKTELHGWERCKSSLAVAIMCEGIKSNCKFPAVDVVRNGGVYELVIGRGKRTQEEYGGHHRAIAHYIEGAPLRCNLLKKHRDKKSSSYTSFIPLGDISLGDYFCESRLSASLRHLPRNVVEKFCRENFLNASKYLSQ